MKKTVNKKIDIFEVLNNISLNNTTYIDKFSDEDLKSLSMYVVQLWIKGATTDRSTRNLLTNEYVNQYVFSLSKHPKLLYKLLCAANGFGKKAFFKFEKKKTISKKNTIELLVKAYDMSFKDASNSLSLFTVKDIEEICDTIGLEKDESKKILAEWE